MRNQRVVDLHPRTKSGQNNPQTQSLLILEFATICAENPVNVIRNDDWIQRASLKSLYVLMLLHVAGAALNNRHDLTFTTVGKGNEGPYSISYSKTVQDFNPSMIGRIAAAHSIGKRVDFIQGIVENFDLISDEPNDGDKHTWQIRLQSYDSLLPAEIAADYLQWFYSLAGYTVNQYIGMDMEDLEDFTLRLGQVALDVFCKDGICWNAMPDFLERMSKLAKEGLVGMYEGHVVNLATGFTMWVKLSIRGPRRPV